MFNKLKSHLYALQLLEYDADEFFDWVLKNPGFYPMPQKGKLGLSIKTKILYTLSTLIQFIVPATLSALILTKHGSTLLYIASTVVFLSSVTVLITIPFIPLTISLFLIKPGEEVFRQLLIRRAASKLKSLKNPFQKIAYKIFD